jgi:dimethyladenosine transferase
MKPIATPTRTQEILRQYGLHAKKKFGQNFIIEPSIIQKIVQAARLDKDTSVIEVGPGIGALSEQLCEVAKYVKAFDIDEDMVQILSQTLADKDNFEVVWQDFLKVDLAKEVCSMPTQHIKIVANLPYYITTKLLEKIALEGQGIDEVIVMVQKDVAVKMACSHDLRDRLPLTLLLENIGTVKMLFEVPRSVFLPSPNVDSAILKISFHKHEDIQGFYEFLKLAFASRRKTLHNNLKKVSFKTPLEKQLADLGYAYDVRAEAMKVEDLKVLYQSTLV